MQLNNQTGADHHKKEKDPLLKFLKKMINLLLFQKPNPWTQIGRCQWRRPSMILQGQKHRAKSRQTLTCKLISTVSKRQFESFVKILQDRNPAAPREVVGNIATIFAQSGKMDMKQAEGSSTFEVPQSLGYGLFVPTYFKTKPPFQNNDSNVYHILHGTTNKGASLILAEELIRPGDFTIHKNPAKCGYPSYGYYSAGEVAAKTVPFSSNIKELSRKILKIGKGTLPVFIGGIYMGRNPHINQNSGGNDEIQRLCGEHGAARGKEKYLVARSEHTTVHGVVITYKNAIEVQTTRH